MPRENYSIGDKLLFAISCQREVTWLKFKHIASVVTSEGIESPTNSGVDSRTNPYQLLRLLDSLGHCDFSFVRGAGSIAIAPPRLARLPLAGAPQAVLVGSRSPSTRHELEEEIEKDRNISLVQSEPGQSPYAAPSRIAVQATSSDALSAMAQSFGVPYSPMPVAWQLLNFTASIDTYRASLQWQPYEPLNWAARAFNHEIGHFTIATGHESLISYTNPVKNTRLHIYRLQGNQAEVDRDWGRYLVLQDMNEHVLWYDNRQSVLATPARIPLPQLFSRTLTLCSGAPQNEGTGSHWRYFRYVPKQIADLVAAKLGQVLRPFTYSGSNT